MCSLCEVAVDASGHLAAVAEDPNPYFHEAMLIHDVRAVLGVVDAA